MWTLIKKKWLVEGRVGNILTRETFLHVYGTLTVQNTNSLYSITDIFVNVSSEYLVVLQDDITLLMIFHFLITCLNKMYCLLSGN